MCGTVFHQDGCLLGSVIELVFKSPLEDEVKPEFFSLSPAVWMEETGAWGDCNLPVYT